MNRGTSAQHVQQEIAVQKQENRYAIFDVDHEVVARTHLAAKNKRARNRLSRQQRQQGSTSQQAPYTQQWSESIPSGSFHHSTSRLTVAAASHLSLPSPSISTSISALREDDSFVAPPSPASRQQHASWMVRNPQLAEDFQEIQTSRNHHAAPEEHLAVRHRTRPSNKAPTSPSQSSNTSSTPVSPSTVATDPPSPSPAPQVAPATLPPPPQMSQIQTFHTTFNSMVIHHLRLRWPAGDDITREEVLSMIQRRLRHTPTSVGRERMSMNDSEEDFIERRALVVAQGLRRDLIEEMNGRRAQAERDLKRAKAERELGRHAERAWRVAESVEV